MTYTDNLLEPDEDEKGQNSEGCTGDPVTCPCESCQAFRIDIEAMSPIHQPTSAIDALCTRSSKTHRPTMNATIPRYAVRTSVNGSVIMA